MLAVPELAHSGSRFAQFLSKDLGGAEFDTPAEVRAGINEAFQNLRKKPQGDKPKADDFIHARDLASNWQRLGTASLLSKG